MKMIKTTLLALIATTLTALPCWWIKSGYDGNYISHVNNTQIHYIGVGQSQAVTFANGMKVALPLTVYVKIHEGENNSTPIYKAVLQYRVKRSGQWITKWVTVKSIDNPTYSLSVTEPVALFGNGTIDPKGLVANDIIFVRYYITDGIIESGDLDATLDNLDCNPSESSGTSHGDGWTAPFIFKVIYNGKRRIGW